MDGVFGRLPPSSVNYINLNSFNMDLINPEMLQYGGRCHSIKSYRGIILQISVSSELPIDRQTSLELIHAIANNTIQSRTI